MKAKINNKEYDIKRYSYKQHSGEFSIEVPFSDYKYFMDWYDLMFNNNGKYPLKKEYIKDVEMTTNIPNVKNGKYVNCWLKSIDWEINTLEPLGVVEIIYDYFQEYKKPKETNIELVPIEIPEGKKLIKTELESGLLLTFENKTNVDNHISELEYVSSKILSVMGIPKEYWITTSTHVPEIKLTPLEIIEKYFTLYDATQNKVVPFKLMPHQKKMLDSFENNNGTIVKQYRQAGVTVLEAAYTATQLILNNKTNVMLFYARLEDGTHFIKLVRDFIKQYSKEKYGELLDPFIVNNIKELTTRNGSSIKCFSSTNNFRGLGDEFFKTVTHVIIDNAAWVELNLVTQGILEYKLPNNVKVIISSTDTSEDNLFKIYWILGYFNKVKLNNIRIYWQEDPRYGKDVKYIFKDILDDDGRFITKESFPSNEWFINMCKCYSFDIKRIECEIGRGFCPTFNDTIQQEKMELRKKLLKLEEYGTYFK